MKIETYKKLIVWQKSIALVKGVYEFSNNLPKDELYGLVAQMKRAAVSIPANIAEGSRRGTRKDFRHFLFNSFGSGAELETYFEIIKKLPFGLKLNSIIVENLLNEIMRMLNKLIHELKD